jgi:hypothetical protein
MALLTVITKKLMSFNQVTLMRALHTVIVFSLFISGVVFSAEEPDPSHCADAIPNNEDYIVSGALLRKTILCLESFIETQNSQEKLVITEEKNTTDSELKKDDLSSVSIKLTNKKNKKTVALISWIDHVHKKTIELPLD